MTIRRQLRIAEPDPHGHHALTCVQNGSALIWIIVIMVAFSSLGAFMAKNFSTTAFAPRESNFTMRAQLLAESGYRLLAEEYFNAGDDPDRNRALDQMNSGTFDVAPDGGGTFNLRVTSYYYRLAADPNGGPTTQARFVGDAGASVPSSGHLSVGDDSTAYEYVSAAYNAGTGTITFTMKPGHSIPSTEVYTTLTPVVRSSVGAVSEGGTLTLDAGVSAVFPPKNGIFWIGDDGYRYEYKSGNDLVNISAPYGHTFAPLSPASGVLIRLNKHVTVQSRGELGGFAVSDATYQVPLDSSGDLAAAGTPETVVATLGDLNESTGSFDSAVVDGNEAIRSSGQDTVSGMQRNEVQTIMHDAHSALRAAGVRGRDNIAPGQSANANMGWGNWSGGGNGNGHGGGNPHPILWLPEEYRWPKAIAYFDWWNADFDMVEYWQDHTRTLSYDVQTKIAVTPDADHYMAGIMLRSDDTVDNGGNTLGVSIIRGDNSLSGDPSTEDGIIDSLVPDNRTGTDPPLLVLWAQKDTNADGDITPYWNYVAGGTTIALWPEEREWLAWAELPAGYCLLDPLSQRYFVDWLTLMIRITEKDMDKNTATFSVGERVNEIKIFLATISTCGGGGNVTTGLPKDFMLDRRRNASTRLDDTNTEIPWPPFDSDNLAAATDTFSLAGGGFSQIRWHLKSSPTTVHGFKIELDGAQSSMDQNAVIRTNAFVTGSYSDAGYPGSNPFPAELGIHSYGDRNGAVYFDDFAVRFKGSDPTSGGGSGFFPATLN